MRITLPYTSLFTYDDGKGIAYISGVNNIKYDVQSRNVLARMGKAHTLKPQLSQDGKYVAFGELNPHKVILYNTEKPEEPVAVYQKRGHLNRAEEVRWFQDRYLLTNATAMLWAVPVDGSPAQCLYADPARTGDDFRVNGDIKSIDTWENEIVISHSYLERDEDPWPTDHVIHLKLQDGKWQKREVRMPHYVQKVRFDRHGGLCVFIEPFHGASRHYSGMPDDFDDDHQEMKLAKGYNYELSNDGEFCSVQVFDDGWYAVLYRTKTWEEICRTDRKDEVVSQIFSIHSQWWLLSGKRDYMLSLNDL